MPRFVYHGETDRIYPRLGLIRPGAEITAAEAPDQRWREKPPARKPAKHKHGDDQATPATPQKES